jgi:hypothetical protein
MEPSISVVKNMFPEVGLMVVTAVKGATSSYSSIRGAIRSLTFDAAETFERKTDVQVGGAIRPVAQVRMCLFQYLPAPLYVIRRQDS